MSAVISGIAVVGIAVSLYMQANQNQFQQIQCMRNQQLELMKLLLEDPALLAVSVTADGMSRDQWRQGIFINLLFKHLEMGYLTGYATERSVAIHVAEYFNIQFVRDWWRGIRKLYHIDASTRKRRRFARIVDTVFTRTEQEWQDAGDWLVRDRHRGLPWPRTTGQQTFAAIAAIAAIAIPLVSYGMIRRRRRR